VHERDAVSPPIARLHRLAEALASYWEKAHTVSCMQRKRGDGNREGEAVERDLTLPVERDTKFIWDSFYT
jgi:hypothetical protein